MKIEQSEIDKIGKWEPILGIAKEQDLKSILGLVSTVLSVNVEDRDQLAKDFLENAVNIVNQIKDENLKELRGQTFPVESELKVLDVVNPGYVVKDEKDGNIFVISFEDFKKIQKRAEMLKISQEAMPREAYEAMKDNVKPATVVAPPLKEEVKEEA